jgi:hypothetical protein
VAVIRPSLNPPTAQVPPVAFITGSHAYGTPREDSDIDLVIFASEETREFLAKKLGEGVEDYGDGTCQLKIGALNLIVCSNSSRHAAWAKGTAQLIAEAKPGNWGGVTAPVTRERAVEVFKSLGISGDEPQVEF